MSETPSLHSKLRSLRRRRSLERRLSAVASVATVVCWALLLTCALDLLFQLNNLQRLFVMLLAAAAIVVRSARTVAPFSRRESLTQLALYVERHAALDSDLIAALQLDAPMRFGGSAAMAKLAVKQGQQAAARIEWPLGFPVRRALRTGALSAVSILVLFGLAFAFPNHAAAFVSRLSLQDAQYPTATVIQEVQINRVIVLADAEFPPQPAPGRAVAGRPIEFRVACSGKLPERGRVVLRSGGREQVIELLRESGEEGRAVYQGLLPRFVSRADYTIYLGDAKTRTAGMELIRYPVVDLRLRIRPPEYAQRRLGATVESGVENVRLLKGSAIDLRIRSSKRLRSATAVIQYAEGKSKPATYALQRGDDGRTWTLKSAGTILQQMSGPLTVRIGVTDSDDLDLEQPLEVRLGVMADRAPEGRASADHRVFLPTAEPLIKYEARDDFAIRSVVARIEVQRDPKTKTANGEPPALEKFQQELYRAQPDNPKNSLLQSRPLSLAPWNLAKGDRARVTLEIVDDRGANPGKVFRCSPIEFLISDELGVYEANSQFDDATNRTLNQLEAEQLKVLTGGDK